MIPNLSCADWVFCRTMTGCHHPHDDDIGMCQATIPAFADLVDFGLSLVWAVMGPAPGSPRAALLPQPRRRVDLGVHLTLTSNG